MTENPNAIKNAKACLNSSSLLQKYSAQLNKEQSLKTAIASISSIDEGLFSIAASDRETLILQTSNATVATQLRLMTSDILSHIEQNFAWKFHFKGLTIKVRPLYQKQRPSQPSHKKINKENSKLLLSVADYIDNPKLQAVLTRLSKHSL